MKDYSDITPKFRETLAKHLTRTTNTTVRVEDIQVTSHIGNDISVHIPAGLQEKHPDKAAIAAHKKEFVDISKFVGGLPSRTDAERKDSLIVGNLGEIVARTQQLAGHPQSLAGLGVAEDGKPFFALEYPEDISPLPKGTPRFPAESKFIAETLEDNVMAIATALSRSVPRWRSH